MDTGILVSCSSQHITPITLCAMRAQENNFTQVTPSDKLQFTPSDIWQVMGLVLPVRDVVIPWTRTMAQRPRGLSLKGSQKFSSLHPQGSKDHSRSKQSFFQRCGASGEAAQSQEVSLGSISALREGLPTTDILLQGKPHEKRALVWSGKGLWTYMVMA